MGQRQARREPGQSGLRARSVIIVIAVAARPSRSRRLARTGLLVSLRRERGVAARGGRDVGLSAHDGWPG